ncbi:MAG TPA: anthrone oxygenase family protein [Chthoniobacterales bacterium]
MIDRLLPSLTFLGAISCGLAAGIFYAFSSLVMRALAKIPPPAGIAAMQSINVSVVNPWFIASFFGPAVICCVLGVVSVVRWNRGGNAYLFAGSAFYLVGTMIVTFAFNVPLNDVLAAVDPASPEGARQWTSYLATWTNWNHVRTAGALFAAVAFYLAK